MHNAKNGVCDNIKELKYFEKILVIERKEKTVWLFL